MNHLREAKLICIGAVMFLTAYPVVELTRCIVQYNIQPLLHMQETGAAIFWITPWNEIPTLDQFYLELTIIWTLYLMLPLFLNLLLSLVFKMGQKSSLK